MAVAVPEMIKTGAISFVSLLASVSHSEYVT